MEKLNELQVIRAMGWLEDAEVMDTIRQQPAVITPKYPYLSVQAEQAVAIKCLTEPREAQKGDGTVLLFIEAELIEPALVWDKEKFNVDKKNYKGHEAPAGTKVSMNLARHAALKRMFLRCIGTQSAVDKELVIANLGKRTFKTPKAPRGTATGYDYRVMLLADLKKKIKKKK